uniref:AlNc14C42G3546 protein n=1 Tax=Albugo laibachii Nc14 TaxID=890382 RepID=F0W9U2_9STRA|nr:AlNc14C42G3546 [Albugo laibachii Nc14]|eukprot:CCA17910.1 AlNc14C42G3546 [Albugo laibachii Nc14]
MSPKDGQEEFRGATPDYAGNAYRDDTQVTARERGPTEDYLDARERGGPSLVKSLLGSDIAVELARTSSCLESMERTRQGYGGGFGLVGKPSRPDEGQILELEDMLQVFLLSTV